MTFDNVQFDSPKEIKVVAEHAELTYGPGAVNLPVKGEDVKIAGAVGTGTANACKDKFVPLPER